MEPNEFIIINEGGTCENSIIWDGVTEWSPPPNTLIVRKDDLGHVFEIGDVVAICLPLPPDPGG